MIYFSPRKPSGFRMRSVTKGVYWVTYPTPGVYTFEFTTTDNDRLTAKARISVTVLKGMYCWLNSDKHMCKCLSCNVASSKVDIGNVIAWHSRISQTII